MSNEATNSSGILRPKRLVINPKIIFPNRPPKLSNDAIHEMWSMSSFPIPNGLSAEPSTVILEALQPTLAPWANNTKLTTQQQLGSTHWFPTHDFISNNIAFRNSIYLQLWPNIDLLHFDRSIIPFQFVSFSSFEKQELNEQRTGSY